MFGVYDNKEPQKSLGSYSSPCAAVPGWAASSAKAAPAFKTAGVTLYHIVLYYSTLYVTYYIVSYFIYYQPVLVQAKAKLGSRQIGSQLSRPLPQNRKVFEWLRVCSFGGQGLGFQSSAFWVKERPPRHQKKAFAALLAASTALTLHPTASCSETT